MQRDGDGHAVGRRRDADFVVGCRHPDGETDDLPRRGQPLHHQRQRERQNCGVCSVGTLSASTANSICASAKLRIDIGSRPPSPSSASRACSTDPIGSRSSITLGATDAGQRALVVTAGWRGDPEDRICDGEPAACGPPLRAAGRRRPPRSVPTLARIRAPGRAHRRGPTIAIPASARCGGSVPGRVGDIAVDQKRLERPEQEPRDILGAAAMLRASASPSGRARPCAIVPARGWRRRHPRRARSRARTPASAAPALAAEAARDSPSAARSMSGPCAR